MRVVILFAVPLGLLTVGCTPMDTGLGEAVRHNYALQTLDPNPQYENVVMEGGAGSRAALAQKNYREGTVIQPMIDSTRNSSNTGDAVSTSEKK